LLLKLEGHSEVGSGADRDRESDGGEAGVVDRDGVLAHRQGKACLSSLVGRGSKPIGVDHGRGDGRGSVARPDKHGASGLLPRVVG